jgi:hypothetical protein
MCPEPSLTTSSPIIVVVFVVGGVVIVAVVVVVVCVRAGCVFFLIGPNTYYIRE